MKVRTYGAAGPLVIVVHGGPGAVGSMTPIARGLADRFRVLEPFQRSSGDGAPLTVARHVADLHGLVESCGAGARPALVGHSWGAMLVLAYAAAHPDEAGPLALIGCGTFDLAARARLREIVAERTTVDVRRQLDRLADEIPDPNKRLAAMGRIMERLYAFDPIDDDAADDAAEAGDDTGRQGVDATGYEQTWQDMLRLQAEGVYPAAFAAIRSPVLMLHGSHDPHPGRMIRDGLQPLLPQLEYRELDRCGHSPWQERQARDEFFAALREWLLRACENRS
ncbi:MAG: alpha/beta hydrolase [Planctomycetes bacterium]|nr:alpha/beta hydrolase [Planctomycetota bacterium]